MAENRRPLFLTKRLGLPLGLQLGLGLGLQLGLGLGLQLGLGLGLGLVNVRYTLSRKLRYLQGVLVGDL